MSEEIVALDRPDLDQLLKVDMPFTAVVEGRRSIRHYGEKPITLRQLGEFLYRSARLKQVIPTDPQELASRPYPGGGSIYELELYVTVKECSDLAPGLYHYAAEAHQLCRLNAPTNLVEALLANAQRSTGLQQGQLQVLIVVAARFQRLMWKYQSLAYALILKNVGVLFQTMYLVATAMDLAPCAVGGGNSDLFAQAAGLDYYTETSVGEFLLGSRAHES
jgi:SagB-type dehydrogenase family enzyme